MFQNGYISLSRGTAGHQIASATVHCNRREEILEIIMNMFRSTVLVLGAVGVSLGGVSYGGYGGGHFEYGYDQTHCHTKYNIKYEQSCHQEYDTVVDTTYTQQCQDIVTQHCNSVSQQVHHSSAVVGHDSQVVSHGHGYGKREADAEAEPGHGRGYSSGPQCQEKVDRQCHKVPQQHERKVARPVCETVVDTTYIEECEETFTTECSQSHTQVHHSSAVVGHDSQVIHGGSYHKREAEAEPGYGGYSSGPQCHEKVERQCQNVPHQVPRQVPRQVCVPVEVKVPYQVCGGSSVHRAQGSSYH